MKTVAELEEEIDRLRREIERVRKEREGLLLELAKNPENLKWMEGVVAGLEMRKEQK